MKKALKLFQKKNKNKMKVYLKVKKRNNNHIKYYVISFFLILVALLTILVIYVTPIYKLSSDGMEPTYKKNDLVVLLKTDNYKRGDIIVFYYNNKPLIKRIVGLPGDIITLSSKNELVVNGSEVKDSYMLDRTFNDINLELPYIVEEGYYFVLNDNHENGLDSRDVSFGCISESQIIGKVKFKIWPI